jgi:hypothetical protein
MDVTEPRLGNFVHDAELAFPAFIRRKAKERRMATQIVMDHTGDSRHHFNAEDAAELLKAERRFNELLKGGYTAAVRSPLGQPTVIRSFDPSAKETLFFPRLVGG